MTASFDPLSVEYSRFRRRLILSCLSIAGLVIGTIFSAVYSSYVERENAARIQTQTFVHAIAAHVEDSIQLVDFALIGFANAIKLLPSEKKNSVATIRQLLASHDPASSDDFSIVFIDANGLGVANSKNAAVQGMSFTDRDYFQAHARTHADRGLYVGEPLIAKISKKRVFTLSRRVVSAQGVFLGVIASPMNAARFAAMFEHARFNQDISIALLNKGGKMIARAPRFEQTFASNLWHSEAFRSFREHAEPSFQANSPFSGKPMLYSFRALESLPLNVFVGMSVQTLNQALRDDLLKAGAGIALMILIMLVSTRVALNSYRALESNKQVLRENELRWKFALEGVGDGVWNWNIETDQVNLSPRWKQILGYAENELKDTFEAWESRLHPDDKPHVLAEIQACLDGKMPVSVNEYRMQCKGGNWKWVLDRALVIKHDAAGRALQMIGTLTDISERKHAELLQMHKMIDAAPDPMLLVANDGIISFANRAAHSTFGYPSNALIGQNVDNLMPPRSRSSHAAYRKDFEIGRIAHPSDAKRPLNAIRKDGTEFPVEVSLSRFQIDGQAVVIASIRDITERKQTTELLQQSFAQLRRLSDHQQNLKEDERKRIAQDIHDDLGQNLLALKMDVDMLYARTANAHPRLHKQVGFALQNIVATIQSVKSIINYLRPAALELGLYPAVMWQLKRFERRNGIACSLVTVVPEPEFGLDDGQTLAIFRIFQESLANIVRHAQATEVEITLSRNESGFTMQVKDNGKGLQPEDRRKANSFGLMGIKERIDLLGGEFVIASSPGNGTVLSISIPLKHDRQMSEDEDASCNYSEPGIR